MRKALAKLALGICATLIGSAAFAVEPAKIAIIIDDLGYNHSTGERALALPEGVSVAVIPFTPYGNLLATQAHDLHHDILVHMPMESADPGRRLDSGGITMAQDEQEVRQRIDKAIQAVPYAVGMNNHMGSEITADPLVMSWVMDEVRNRTPFFFVDSMTNAHSVAEATALHHDVASVRRDIFLDNKPETPAIAAEFQRLIKIARDNGYAVAIGHPHSTTLDYLAQEIPRLKSMGIELVPISALTREYGRPRTTPVQPQDVMRWIVAMPPPTSSRLNFTN